MFYPMTGPSSFEGAVPVSKGGTGATDPAAARANLGAVGSLLFGADYELTLTAPTGDTITFQSVYANKTNDGKHLIVWGTFYISFSASAGWRDISVSGISVAAPSSAVTIHNCGIVIDTHAGTSNPVTPVYYSLAAVLKLTVSAEGEITISVYHPFATPDAYAVILQPFIIPLA